MKIYTRTGDTGETGLLGGGRVYKHDPRVEAYGDVDEANSAIGVAACALAREGQPEIAERLGSVQEDLFAIGAHLAAPAGTESTPVARHLPPLPSSRPAVFETWIDESDAELPTLRHFILPGGTEAAAALHLARTVCRRAERRVVALEQVSGVDPTIIVYLNRLSDLLFALARLANRRAGREDVIWTGRR